MVQYPILLECCSLLAQSTLVIGVEPRRVHQWAPLSYSTSCLYLSFERPGSIRSSYVDWAARYTWQLHWHACILLCGWSGDDWALMFTYIVYIIIYYNVWYNNVGSVVSMTVYNILCVHNMCRWNGHDWALILTPVLIYGYNPLVSMTVFNGIRRPANINLFPSLSVKAWMSCFQDLRVVFCMTLLLLVPVHKKII